MNRAEFGIVLMALMVATAAAFSPASVSSREQSDGEHGFGSRADAPRLTGLRTDTVDLFDNEDRIAGTLTRLGLPEEGADVLAVRPGYVAVQIASELLWLRISDVHLSNDFRRVPCGSHSYTQSVFIRYGFEEILDEDVRCMISVGPVASVDVPFLPWPPPRPAYASDVSRQIRQSATFGETARTIAAVLQARGYDRLRYFSVPGGFAVATAVERVREDGGPAPDRWATSKRARVGSFYGYVRSLIMGEQGRFRLFVLAVTDTDISLAPFQANQEDVERWQAMGRPELSRQLAGQKISRASRSWLLVYEFHPSADGRTRLVATTEPDLPLAVHMRALGFR